MRLIHNKKNMVLDVQGQSICGDRLLNQDRIYLNEFQNRDSTEEYSEKQFDVGKNSFLCFAVADGVGGARHGEKASLYAMEGLSEWQKSVQSDENDIIAYIKEGFFDINQKIIDYSNSIYSESATTLTALVFFGDKFYLANVGDSPAFLLRNENIIQLDQDQSLGKAEGLDDKKDGFSSNVLVSFLGNRRAQGDEMVHVTRGTYRENDIFFLCSDGVTKVLTKNEIKTVLRSRNNDIKNIFRIIQSREPRDNSTGIIVRVLSK